MPTAFISYVRSDADAANRLAQELLDRQLMVHPLRPLTLAPAESEADELSHAQHAIAGSDLVFVLSSPRAERSQLLATEVALAISEAQRRPLRVVPVLLDAHARAPELLRDVPHVAFYDAELAKKQLDELIWSSSVMPPKSGSRLESKEVIALLQSQRKALQAEQTESNVKRAVDSAAVRSSLTSLTLAFALGGAILVLYKLPTGRLSYLVSFDSFVSFSIGALAALGGTQIASLIRRKFHGRK